MADQYTAIVVYDEESVPQVWSVTWNEQGYRCRIFSLSREDLGYVLDPETATPHNGHRVVIPIPGPEVAFNDVDAAREYFATNYDLALQGESFRLFKMIDPVRYAD